MELTLVLLLTLGLAVAGYNFLNTKPRLPKEDEEPNRDRIRDLILGKAKAQIFYSGTSISVHRKEANYLGLQHRYKFGKLFELAAQQPEGRLPLNNGDQIAPHSREHGLESGKAADQLRAMVIREYGIDLENMEDLEIDPASSAHKKAERLLSFTSPSDLDNLPDKG